jgi:aminoglycoside 6'-N-acetyltransferase
MSAARIDAVPAALSIRPATPDDEPAMIELEHASAVHHAAIDPVRWRLPDSDAIAAYRRKRRLADPGGVALVAVVEGRVVGMVELLPRGGVQDAGAARTATRSVDIGLSVAEDWRGRGVGTALMDAAETWARGHGASRMILDLAAANSGAKRLYRRLGYEVHGLLMDKPLDGAPAGERPARSTGREDVPTLAGEVVRLRPLVDGDREALIEVLSDPTVIEWWDTRGPEHSADELITGEPGWFVWAIEADGEFAGSIQASEEDDPDYRHAGIDIFLSSRFQGRGLGTDAVRTLARWLFDERGHHRLTIDPSAANARAIRTYEKVGFKPVGVMRGYERGVDHTFHDGLLMDMLRGELR